MSDSIERAPVFTVVEAADLACKLRENGKQIVFTNGCFDLLHPGHLEILERARQLGDFLFVGLNSDDSVERLKGPLRPVQPLDSRAAVLASLRSVDCVIPFSQDTPLELINRLLPDILVKGGDYTVEQVIGAQTVIRNGGRVEIIPLVKGYSTTALIKEMD